MPPSALPQPAQLELSAQPPEPPPFLQRKRGARTDRNYLRAAGKPLGKLKQRQHLDCRIAWIAGAESAAQRMTEAGGDIGQLHYNTNHVMGSSVLNFGDNLPSLKIRERGSQTN